MVPFLVPEKDQSLIIDQLLAQHHHIVAAQVIVGHQADQEVEVKSDMHDLIDATIDSCNQSKQKRGKF